MDCRPITHYVTTGWLWWRRHRTEQWCHLHGTRWDTRRERCSTAATAPSTVTL